MSDREHEEVVEVERTDDEPLLGLKGSQTTSDREHKEVMEDKLSDEKLSKLERGRKKMSELQRGGEIACYITVVEDKQSDEELSKLFRARAQAPTPQPQVQLLKTFSSSSRSAAMNILPKDFASPGRIAPPKSLDIGEVPGPAVQSFNDAHPLENRVANWKANEEAFKMKLLQRTQGSAEPIRRTMEMKIIEDSTFVPSLIGGPSNVHLDILRNTDTSIDWEDVYSESDNRFDFHEELQRKMAI